MNATSANSCIIDSALSMAPFQKSGYTFLAAGNTPVMGINSGFEANATPAMVDIRASGLSARTRPGCFVPISPVWRLELAREHALRWRRLSWVTNLEG